jgi:FkbM family methyltransferase
MRSNFASRVVTLNGEHIVPQVLLRSWPFPYGQARLLDRFFSGLSFECETARIRTTDDFEMTVMPNEYIGRHLYLTGEFDRAIVAVLCQLARPGDTLLDVGANVGYVSASFLRNIPDSHAIAIEPHPMVAGLLRQNLSQFGSRSSVIEAAVSDRDDQAWLATEEQNLGKSHLAAHSVRGMKVRVLSPDSIIDVLRPERIDLIKIDAEGHEEAIVAALRSHLSSRGTRAILFEDLLKKAAPDGTIGTIFGRAGYRVFGIRKHLTRLTRHPVRNERDCRFKDYLALSFPG